jgi:hypothetical protein
MNKERRKAVARIIEQLGAVRDELDGMFSQERNDDAADALESASDHIEIAIDALETTQPQSG